MESDIFFFCFHTDNSGAVPIFSLLSRSPLFSVFVAYLISLLRTGPRYNLPQRRPDSAAIDYAHGRFQVFPFAVPRAAYRLLFLMIPS